MIMKESKDCVVNHASAAVLSSLDVLDGIPCIFVISSLEFVNFSSRMCS